MVIAYHFTNHLVAYGGNAPWRSTGFVESITQEGARQFLNVGIGDALKVRHTFQHHGIRCNKKRVRGTRSIPAVILLDLTGITVQQGYDDKLHKQVNQVVPPERVVGWFSFEPSINDEQYSEQIAKVLNK